MKIYKYLHSCVDMPKFVTVFHSSARDFNIFLASTSLSADILTSLIGRPAIYLNVFHMRRVIVT